MGNSDGQRALLIAGVSAGFVLLLCCGCPLSFIVNYWPTAEERRAFEAADAARQERDRLAAIKRDGERQAREKAQAEEDRKYAAWVMAQGFVKDKLKSPSTASFGTAFGESQDPLECVTSLGDNTYRVSGWVDSQNGFGATLRSQFTVKLKDEPDSEKWVLLEPPVIVQR